MTREESPKMTRVDMFERSPDTSVQLTFPLDVQPIFWVSLTVYLEKICPSYFFRIRCNTWRTTKNDPSWYVSTTSDPKNPDTFGNRKVTWTIGQQGRFEYVQPIFWVSLTVYQENCCPSYSDPFEPLDVQPIFWVSLTVYLSNCCPSYFSAVQVTLG